MAWLPPSGLIQWLRSIDQSVRRDFGIGRDAEGASSARKRSARKRRTAEIQDLHTALESGGRDTSSPTEGCGAACALISQVTGQRAADVRYEHPPPFLFADSIRRDRRTCGKKTALFDLHCTLGARMVDFGGWDMPLQYGSQLAEHHAVRRAAGVFDVSHMVSSICTARGRARFWNCYWRMTSAN